MKRISKFKLYFILPLAVLSIYSIAATRADYSNSTPKDRVSSTYIADLQKRSLKNDAEVSRLIRARILKDDSLSAHAKKVKIITHSGITMLRGSVHSDEEIAKLVTIAREIAGEEFVRDQLEVKL